MFHATGVSCDRILVAGGNIKIEMKYHERKLHENETDVSVSARGTPSICASWAERTTFGAFTNDELPTRKLAPILFSTDI